MTTGQEIERLGVMGAGQMGAGIAHVAAVTGLQVVLGDVSLDVAEQGKAGIAARLERAVSKGRLDAALRDAALERITPVGGADGFSNVQLAVEAVSEKLTIKELVIRALDDAMPEGAILASNTSSISITKLAAFTRRPEQVIGMHFMNPVPVMKLVEVIRALGTDEPTYRSTVALAERMGKTCITSRDVPGFIVNRLLMPLLNEACFALHEGLGTAEDIDTGIKLGLGHPMGPLTLADLIGLDTCLAICEVLHRELGEDKYRPSPVLRQYVDAGWLGRKSGRGFYRYDA